MDPDRGEYRNDWAWLGPVRTGNATFEATHSLPQERCEPVSNGTSNGGLISQAIKVDETAIARASAVEVSVRSRDSQCEGLGLRGWCGTDRNTLGMQMFQHRCGV